MRVVILIAALSCVSCGLTDPSDDLTGTWMTGTIGHTDFVGMTLHQSGDVITGTACATSAGKVIYKNVPVHGEYPNLQFTVAVDQTEPCCSGMAGRAFRGKQDKTLDIVGNYGTFDLRFERSGTSLCP